ncbi:MAG: hypothetical protein WDA16_15080 [Candidatus Thermoplasmatota archaeon]
MAKSKKSIDDLDAELAALEAELAALEGKPKGAPPVAKRGLAFGKKKEVPPAQAPPAPAPPPVGDLSLWRRDGDAWVRTVPGHGPIVRRVLDEQGNVIREESVTRSELEGVSEVKAERGVGRLLGRLKK